MALSPDLRSRRMSGGSLLACLLPIDSSTRAFQSCATDAHAHTLAKPAGVSLCWFFSACFPWLRLSTESRASGLSAPMPGHRFVLSRRDPGSGEVCRCERTEGQCLLSMFSTWSASGGIGASLKESGPKGPGQGLHVHFGSRKAYIPTVG